MIVPTQVGAESSRSPNEPSTCRCLSRLQAQALRGRWILYPRRPAPGFRGFFFFLPTWAAGRKEERGDSSIFILSFPGTHIVQEELLGKQKVKIQWVKDGLINGTGRPRYLMTADRDLSHAGACTERGPQPVTHHMWKELARPRKAQGLTSRRCVHVWNRKHEARASG